ncbi:MAG: CsiV family protein [Stagnimonas sp.]|nr:CsiV family protein [Stagnimonas sp.]
MTRLAVALLAIALPLSAMAERLRVDVLIFLNPLSADEQGTAPRHPDDERAIDLDDAPGLAYAGIALLPDNASTLAAEWATLSASKRYKPLLRLSWVQESPSSANGPALRLELPGGDRLSSLSGWLRLQGGRNISLSADLESVQPGSARQPLGLRLQERRTLGLDTLHYLDSPRIGVLARVTAAR